MSRREQHRGDSGPSACRCASSSFLRLQLRINSKKCSLPRRYGCHSGVLTTKGSRIMQRKRVTSEDSQHAPDFPAQQQMQEAVAQTLKRNDSRTEQPECKQETVRMRTREHGTPSCSRKTATVAVKDSKQRKVFIASHSFAVNVRILSPQTAAKLGSARMT